jgi:cephalosporin hydroxylase
MTQSNWTIAHPGSFRPRYAAPGLTPKEQEIVDAFHHLYYSRMDSNRTHHTIVLSWMGYEMYKCPLDLWIYQELIFFNRPQIIIETGTYMGGSALFLATMLDLVGQGEVITIDSDLTYDSCRPRHPRITYLTGSSVDPAILGEVGKRLLGKPNVMVILDADHRKDHVLAELRAYAPFVPLNGYMIVEDTNINGHPTYPDFGPGPWEAVTAFLEERVDFAADRGCERFLVTMNPRGFLKRRA